MRKRNAPREKGAAAVEFALATPILLILVLGGLHLGRALTTRHRLADATNYATRAAAIKKITNPVVLRNWIIARMDTGISNCTGLAVNTQILPGLGGTQRLEVRTRCVLAPPFGAAVLGALPPGDVEVTAAMPY